VDREYDLTAATLLQAMDAAGVERAVIVPPDRNLAVYNREGNDSVLRAAHEHPVRFIPACSVNPWYGPPAVEELRRALGEGARMFVLHPYVQGFAASDELIFPVLEEAGVQKVPVYIHTGTPGNSTPWQITELADRYPQVDFIMGHCGATDFWNDVINATTAAPNIYLESSMARPFNFAQYLTAVGKWRGVVGSGAPLNNFLFEWEQVRNFVPPEVLDVVAGENLAGLLAKRGPL
jgi:hypothetical protein